MIRIAFDIGGTFTDFVLEDTQTGKRHFGKLPSTPSEPARGVLEGLSEILQRTKVPAGDVSTLLHATTVATNAVLERKGAKTALITTKGFRDILIIGRQKRYETYDLYLDKPQPLVKRRDIFEVAERVHYDGRVEAKAKHDEIDALLTEIGKDGYESLAVSLLHAYADPSHERLIGDRAAAIAPDLTVSLSSTVSAKFREYERTSTAVANAYIKPLVGKYVRALEKSLSARGVDADLFIMQSNGGLVSPELAAENPVRIVESGPAAGVLMCAEVGRQEGFDHVLTFDMGGTTAKLGAIDHGVPAIVPTFEVDQVRYRKGSGLPLNIAAIELLEIGAGGGSIGATDMGLIKVGPESSGAEPGPICYGFGGTRPTVTDANLVLGYIDPDYFNGGAMKLDFAGAKAGIAKHIGEPLGLEPAEAAWGIYTIANANMERAMRIVSVERGRDPRKYTMVAFGGAGPLHACRLARAIGIPKVIVPHGAGVGSAIGLLEANSKLDQSVTRVLRLAPGTETAAADIYADLEKRLQADIDRLRSKNKPTWSRFAYMRYAGQGHEIRVDLPNGPFTTSFADEAAARFQEAYAQVYGYRDRNAGIEIVDWYLAATLPNAGKGEREKPQLPSQKGNGKRATRKAYFPEKGGFVDCAVYDRYALARDETVSGPAIIEERESTVVVLPGDTASVSEHGNLVIMVGEDDEGA
ncbi:MAG: hydantoinase/oxoprolinase family protein [Variibacter sp.]